MATSVLFAVIATLALIVVRGPARFFEARTVQMGASCTVRHCPATEDQPEGPEALRKLPQ